MAWYWFVIIIVGIKAILNLYRLYLANRYFDNFKDFLIDKSEKALSDRNQVVALFKSAGMSDSYLPHAESIGWGQIANVTLSMFKNYPSKYQHLTVATYTAFQEAIGIFKSRTLNAFNPLYWLELIVFLPKHALTSLGIKTNSAWIKVSQFIYWVIGIIVAILISTYNAEISVFVKGIFG